jgi:hypothetical protein
VNTPCRAGWPSLTVVLMQNDVHVRSQVTGLYLNSRGSWSALKAARKFLTINDAKDWCAQEQPEKVEIVVVRDSLVCMRVPVAQETGA